MRAAIDGGVAALEGAVTGALLDAVAGGDAYDGRTALARDALLGNVSASVEELRGAIADDVQARITAARAS
eukprot:5756255-Prymnesium_polylepis.1